MEAPRRPACWDDMRQLLERYAATVDATGQPYLKSPLFAISEARDDVASIDFLEALERQPGRQRTSMPSSITGLFSEYCVLVTFQLGSCALTCVGTIFYHTILSSVI